MDHVCGGIARRGSENASQTNEFPGRWQSGQSQQAVNLPPSGYGGSNPPLPTNLSALNERAVRLAALSVWRQARGAEWGRFKGWRTGRERRDEHVGGSNSVVESQPSKLLVAGSIPVSRSTLRSSRAEDCCGRLGRP